MRRIPFRSTPQYLHHFYARRDTLIVCCDRLSWHDETHGFALWPRSKNLETQIFWFLATVTCALAFGFEFKRKSLLTGTGQSSRSDLVNSQGKDNRLICIVVWSVIFVDSPPYGEVVRVLGSLVLGWAAWRTLRRMRILHR